MRAKIDQIELSIAVMVKKGERNNQEREIAVIDQYLPRAVKHTYGVYEVHPRTNDSDNRLPTELQTDSMARFTGFKIEYETGQGKMRAWLICECWLLSSALVIYPGLVNQKRGLLGLADLQPLGPMCPTLIIIMVIMIRTMTATNREYAVCRA